MGIVLSSVVL